MGKPIENLENLEVEGSQVRGNRTRREAEYALQGTKWEKVCINDASV